ncbi:MAG: hypothetical protein EXS31_00870 [Pedosphaera sp.]|nr:hypothetical protein [Pedosphaera sp.]
MAWLQLMRKIIPLFGRAVQLGLLSKDLARFKFTRNAAAPAAAEQRIVERLAKLHGLPQKIGQLLSSTQLPGTERSFSCLTEGPPSLPEAVALKEMARQLSRCSGSKRGDVRRSARRLFTPNDSSSILSECFDSINPRGVGASLGQVHRAVLHSGEAVAVKIKYPKAAGQLQADLMALGWLTKPIGSLRRGFDLGAYRREIGGMLQAELDYRQEAEWLKKFGEWTRSWGHFEVPRVIGHLSGSRILTMTWVDGESFESVRAWTEVQRRAVGESLLKFFLHGCFEWGAVHADPHSGNYRFRLAGEEVKVGVLDFGCVKSLDAGLATGLARWMQDVVAGKGSDDAAWDCHIQMGYEPTTLEPLRSKLGDVSRILFEPFCMDGRYDVRKWNLSQRLADILGEHRLNYRIAAPPGMVYLVRAFQGLLAYLHALDVTVDWRRQMPSVCQRKAPLPEAMPDTRFAKALSPLESNPPRTKMKAELLRIKVVESGVSRADLSFSAEAADNLTELVPLELREKLLERSIDLKTTTLKIQRSGYAPGPVFELNDGPKQIRVWLE